MIGNRLPDNTERIAQSRKQLVNLVLRRQMKRNTRDSFLMTGSHFSILILEVILVLFLESSGPLNLETGRQDE